MNADFKLHLESLGWSVVDEEGSIFGHKDLGDRSLQLDLSDLERSFGHGPSESRLQAYLSFHALRKVEDVILRPLALPSHCSQHTRQQFPVQFCGRRLECAMNHAENWARTVDLNLLLESLVLERPDRPSIPQINHLVALAFLGRFGVLEEYSDSFSRGRHLNFVPTITQEVIDAALDVAYDRYAANRTEHVEDGFSPPCA